MKAFYISEYSSIKSNTFNTVVKWIALVVTIAGAVCNAYLIIPLNIYLGNVGSILYLVWAIRICDVNIALVNFGLLIIYFSGLFYHS